MNAAAAVGFGALLSSAIGYWVVSFWSAGMVTPVALPSFALTSVTYTMPASASPRVILVTTPPTLVSSLTGLTVTPAFLKMAVATCPHGTAGAQTTTLTAGLARLLTDLMCLGLPFATMISPLLVAKSFGVLDASPASVTVFMFDGAAEAKTSAGAPWLMEVASDELPW